MKYYNLIGRVNIWKTMFMKMKVMMIFMKMVYKKMNSKVASIKIMHK